MVDRRQYQRLAIRLPITFSGDQTEGTGTVTDISMGGCGLETEAQCATGTLLQLQLRTSDQEPPVTVDAAAVRSVRAKFVGVQFLRVRPEEKDRLSRFIRNLLIAARRP
jgi:c-di-GMP-binding flagellar brake protein YcgR